MNSRENLAQLGVAAAALMHDLQALLGSIEEHSAFAMEELEAGRLPLHATRACVARSQEARDMIADVLASLSSATPAGRFDPVRALHRAIERVVETAAPTLIHCRVSVPSGAMVAGRSTLLERAVGNLVRNALRHAQERVEVSMHFHAAEGRESVLIAVEDDGSGVPESLRSQVFSAGVHGGHGGSGVGLASVSWAAASLGGRANLVEPEILGGARFEMWIPLTPREAQPISEPVEGLLSGRTVAIIDDDPSIQRLAVRLLSRAGARVAVVELRPPQLEHALVELDAICPDLILLDWNLGGVSGAAVWERLRERNPELARRVALFSGAAGWPGTDIISALPTIPKGLAIRDLVLEIAQLIRRWETSRTTATGE